MRLFAGGLCSVLRVTSVSEGNDYSLRHLTVSTQWQDVKEPWVQRTFAFVCAPGNRNNNDMLAMGKMEYMQMIQTAQAMFEKMGPSQKRNQMIDDLDTLLGNEK